MKKVMIVIQISKLFILIAIELMESSYLSLIYTFTHFRDTILATNGYGVMDHKCMRRFRD